MTNSLETKEALWQEYLNTNPSARDLKDIILCQKEDPFLRGKALESLLEKEEIDPWLLKQIILFVEDFRHAAWEKFKKMEPSTSDLDHIFLKFPEYREEIKDIFGRTPGQILVEIRD